MSDVNGTLIGSSERSCHEAEDKSGIDQGFDSVSLDRQCTVAERRLQNELHELL